MNAAVGAEGPLALVSVSDKTGIVEFCRALAEMGFRLLSTGGTARALTAAGLPVTEVSDHTDSPEIMGGRVKTLHPRVHGGLLGRRGVDDDVMSQQDIPAIDLAVINLYPFEAVTAREDCSFEDAIENIDIGGPAMVRSAAKNFESVAIVTSPDQYERVLEKLEAGEGRLDRKTRFELSVAAFNRVAQYDDAISSYLSARAPDGSAELFPAQENACYIKVADLRYGENPHQQAAWYRDLCPAEGSLATAVQHQGKELSYNNIVDLVAALKLAADFDESCCAVIKHTNPCGVGRGASPLEALENALSCDPVSAFGGIFEHSPWIAEAAWALELGPTHDTARGVHAALARVFRSADDAARLAVLKAHPDLAGKLAAAKRLTAESTAEQAAAGLFDLSAAQRIAGRWQIFLEMVNLTDEPYIVYQGDRSQPIQQEYYSWWGHLGIKYSL